jgi:hypothetical protein
VYDESSLHGEGEGVSTPRLSVVVTSKDVTVLCAGVALNVAHDVLQGKFGIDHCCTSPKKSELPRLVLNSST